MKLLLALALIAVLVVSGCTTAEPAAPPAAPLVAQPAASEPPATPPATPPPSPPTTPPTPPATPPSPVVQEFSVTAKQFEFVPSTITVNQGDTVRLRVTSQDVNHGLLISGYNKSMDLQPGKEAVLEFVADQKGEFAFSCSVFCGSGHGGMRGSLIVQ